MRAVARWPLTATVGMLVLAAARLTSGGDPPATPVEAEMLLNLDLLRETDLRRDPNVLERVGIVERMGLLERLPLLESSAPIQAAPTPVETAPRKVK
jgi:hypothetical protein